MKRIALLVSVLIFSTFMVSAQSINDAGAKFNEANESFKAKDYAKAIESYTEALNMCEALGEEGAELGEKIKKQIPNAYVNQGKTQMQSKDLDGAIATLTTAIAESQKYNNVKAEKSANKLLSNAYLAKAGNAYQAKDFDNAPDLCGKAIASNEAATKAYLYETLIYSEQNDEEKMIEAANLTIKYAMEAKEPDEKTASQAKSTAYTYFINKAQEAFGKKKYADAVTDLDKALQFDEQSQTALYLKASSLNFQGKNDDAIKTALLGLEAPDNDHTQFLGINLELARAYEAKGDTENACKYYKIAAQSPNFKAEAEGKMKDVLKCN